MERERSEYLKGWQRTQADLINYKKETEKRVKEWEEKGVVRTVEELLAVLDNLERSIDNLPEKTGQWGVGIRQVLKQFQDILKSLGVEEIPLPENKDEIDPRYHEVIDGEGEKITVYQKGYKYKDKVIRPTKIILQ